jgi:hypothetical protein
MTSGIFLTDTLCGPAGRLNLIDQAKEYLESIAALNPGAKVVQAMSGNRKVNIANKTITVDVMLADTTREDGWLHAIAEFQKAVTRSLQGDMPGTALENSPV